MINYKDDLNPQQLEAVINGDGPCLVLAGAGSGKTRTITYRVAYLLEQAVRPENILLLTFTNKAANEMIERIKKITGIECKLPYAGTFHSIANKILRHYAPAIGYNNNFTILDEDDSKSILKLCIDEFKPSSDKKFPSVNILKSIISYTRNAQTTIEDVLDLKYPQFLGFAENIKNIAGSYDKKKKESNAMDFDDLLVNWFLLLNNSDIQKKLSEQFKYILVDEYQDTNHIQSSIVRKLSLTHGNVLVVGDDAQSIYSFRAADIKNILDFEKEYPKSKIFKLEINYRSSSEILELANDVIANNLKQYKKELRTIESNGIKPALHPHLDQTQEAQFIVSRIKEKLEAGMSPHEIAVLFRAAFHSQMLEMELVKAGIVYDYRGGLRFFDRAHIKDSLAYLRILNNLADISAWMRILTHEEGIGPAGVQRFVENVVNVGNVRDVVNVGNEIFNGKTKQGWNNFVQIWEQLLEIGKLDVSALIITIKESNYKDYLEAEFENARDRLDDIEQLAVFAKKTKSLEEFLDEATLQEGTDFQRTNTHGSKQFVTDTQIRDKKIVLSTIHQAKGLEWDSVFVINLAGGAFPSDRAWKERNGIEEERRLFYVAITRAKNNLYLTYPMTGGSWGGNAGGPSMFLDEISQHLLDDHSLLSHPCIVLDDEIKDVKYVDEDEEWKPKKRTGFLIDV
jgi:DNA helicase-2/ATP-dependent DNA helicase PcrA